MGLFAALLATAGVVVVEQSTHADGIVRCWGSNDYGQCNAPAELGTCSKVAGGAFHTVALRSDGGVRCWGWNNYGQCDTPADLGACSIVAAGGYHTVTIRSDGSVRCWGDNRDGQCNTPTDLGACSNVAAGGIHTIALRIDGGVQCWGYNNYDQCNTPADLGACSSVAGGFLHTVALRSDGGVRCWGDNVYGQCDTPADLGPCSGVAGGGYHTVALRGDGGVRCWGRNNAGQSETPADLGPCLRVVGGGFHTITSRSGGGVRCWGWSNYGQCFTPVDLGACSSVAGGGYHTIAIEAPCPPCPSSLNENCIVNGADLGILLNAWGSCPAGTTGCTGDINADGFVNGTDLGILLNAWGPCLATIIVPTWATLVEAMPDPAVVTDTTLRAAIAATGLAWRVHDTATQMEMLLVPPGTFSMGCTVSNQYGCRDNENPTHSVTLTQAFYLGRCEVTQSQWVARMGLNPSFFQSQSDSASRPVEHVSWNTIQLYLSATGMRLPSEAEWEYACRASTTTAFNNGSSDGATVGTIAWYSSNSEFQTHAVGGNAANALGLFDMSGNVWEWVNDWYDDNYYSVSPPTNPLGPVSGTYRVLRGGSWNYNTNFARSSFRSYDWPDYAITNIGFRVARNP